MYVYNTLGYEKSIISGSLMELFSHIIGWYNEFAFLIQFINQFAVCVYLCPLCVLGGKYINFPLKHPFLVLDIVFLV